MSPHCKTEEEYKISKALLSANLLHSDFLDVTSEAVDNQIGTFVREHVEPHEAFFVFTVDAIFATLTHTPTTRHARGQTMV